MKKTVKTLRNREELNLFNSVDKVFVKIQLGESGWNILNSSDKKEWLLVDEKLRLRQVLFLVENIERSNRSINEKNKRFLKKAQ